MEVKKDIWPDGLHCAVCLCFDFDAETLWISRNEENLNRPVTLSQGTFGAKVAVPKLLELLNEHNEKEQSYHILQILLMENKSAALISDAGTPLFADPGNNLVWQCHQNGIQVVPIPGASSIMAALMIIGLATDKFLYYGFLPANKEKRLEAIKKIPTHLNVILLETPYRLKPILRDMIRVLGQQRQALIAYKLTQPQEKIFWGNLTELSQMTEELPKGEFVFILKKLESKRKKNG